MLPHRGLDRSGSGGVGRGTLLVVRFALALGALAVVLAIPVGVYRLRSVAVPLADAFLVAGSGAVALAALGLAVGTATRVSAAGYLVPVAHWAFDWGTRGAHTGRLTLFARSLGEAWWADSKVALIAVSVGLVALTYWALSRRR